MSAISTHILDIAQGRPASAVPVTLEIRREGVGADGCWERLAACETDADGRVKNLLPDGTALSPAVYRLRFDTGAYFKAQGIESFYPHVAIVFQVRDAAQHYHVPLLLSPFGYSTYRGS